MFYPRIVLPLDEKQMQKIDKKKHVLRLETNCTPYFLEDQVNCLNLKKLREMKMLSNWHFQKHFPIVSKYNNIILSIFKRANPGFLKMVHILVNEGSEHMINKIPPEVVNVSLHFQRSEQMNHDMLKAVLKQFLEKPNLKKLALSGIGLYEPLFLQPSSPFIQTLSIERTKDVKISEWNMGNLKCLTVQDSYQPVTDLEHVFNGCPKLEKLNIDISQIPRDNGYRKWEEKLMECEESDSNGVHWAFKLSANLVPCGAHVRYTCESHGPMATGCVELSFNKEKKPETVSIYSF